jgi:phosphoglucosamine mutase
MKSAASIRTTVNGNAKRLFGTDGVRGLANVYPMTPEIALSLGQAIAIRLRYDKSTRRIIIGKDTRRSSYMIEQAIAAGVCSMGSEAVFLGPIPTPGVAFLTKAMRADAGIMISASHNPYSDNGIKVFDRDGFKLTDEVEVELEEMIDKLSHVERPTGNKIGKAFRVDDAQGRYIEFLKRTYPKDSSLEGVKVVIDCANGAAYAVAPKVLWELGAEVIPVAVEPSGTNINERCGALHPKNLSDAVRECGADFGMALDGDADRVILADENGQIVDGDKVIALCALEMKSQGVLKNNKIVGTILTNMGVENYLKGQDIGMVRTTVGDRYIIEAMRKYNLKLGGEPSGHVIFSRHTTTGDGVIAGLQVLATMVSSGKKLSALVQAIPLYPQVSQNIRVQERTPLEDVAPIQDAIHAVEKRLGGKGRVVMRYSGTEPVLRLMLEGEDPSAIQQEQDALTQVITANLR